MINYSTKLKLLIFHCYKSINTFFYYANIFWNNSFLCFIFLPIEIKILYNAEKEGAGEYRGPSVLSWTLDGRRALYLPIPAYKCAGEGIVYVQIVVGKNGYVKKTTVISAPSASDECLRSCALDAARVSRFSRSDIASDNQLGEIVYKFIAQ